MGVKQLREAIGLAQKDLAAAIGVTPAAVCGWENGKIKTITRENIQKMHDLYGWSSDDILDIRTSRTNESA